MTPLAQEIANELCKPLKDRQLYDPDGKAKLILDSHCFEMTAVRELTATLAEKLEDMREPQQRLAFLPSPVTVLDWHDPWFLDAEVGEPQAARDGYMLIESADQLIAEVYAIGGAPIFGAHLTPVGKLALRDMAALDGVGRHEGRGPAARRRNDADLMLYRHLQAKIYAALAMINTPRIIGRRMHLPHTGLQRKLAALHHMPGKYPLHAWHEVILEIGPPKIDEHDAEVRLSGGRALHFCRAYLRVRSGIIEIVSSHWRGDPALGIAQTRYRLVKEGHTR